MLLRSLNCADGAGISAAKKEITTLEGALQHQHHHLRPLSLDRRQVRHHRLPGGAGHPPPDRGHLDPGGHGHSLRLLRQHRQPRPGQAHQRGVHRPDCQRSPPANAGSRLAARCRCQRAHGWHEIVRPLGTARYRWRVAADSAQSAWAAIRKTAMRNGSPAPEKPGKQNFAKEIGQSVQKSSSSFVQYAIFVKAIDILNCL